MPPRDGAAVRRERLQRIIAIVKKRPGLHIGKIQTQMALQTGLTAKRVAQYTRELTQGGVIKVDENGGFRLVADE